MNCGSCRTGRRPSAAALRGLVRALVCGLAVTIPGCPLVELCSDVVCEDGDPCTTDSCVATTGQCSFEPVECVEGFVCDAESASCIDRCSLQDCDDGNPCTDDACSAGECTTTESTSPCDDGDSCTVGDTCAGGICAGTALDCDDDDTCTQDACVDGACSYTDWECPDREVCIDGTCMAACQDASDCDDGVFCNGAEICESSLCAAGADRCPGLSCDEEEGVCTGCTTDDQCDDGLFCNGPEICDNNGVCRAGADPCVPLCSEVPDPCTYRGSCYEGCSEGTDICVQLLKSSGPRLYAGTDTLTGSRCDDVFDGTLEVLSGNIFQTLDDSDSLDGGDGVDTLVAQFLHGGTTTPSALTNIEIFTLEVTDGNATTLDLVNADAVTTINNHHSSADGGDLTVINVLPAPTNIGWWSGAEVFTVNIVTSALSGSANACTINIRGVVDVDDEAILTIQPAAVASGYEIFNLVSEGAVDNVLRQLTGGNGTSLRTINLTGPTKITIEADLDTSVTTVDASLATGGVGVAVGGVTTTCIAGTGSDVFDFGDGSDTYQSHSSTIGNPDVIRDFSAADMLDLSSYVTDNAAAGTVTDGSSSDQMVASEEIWIVTDADGSTDTATEVAALFGGGGKPFAEGVPDMEVIVIIQDTQAGGSSTIWFVDDGDSNSTVTAGECAKVVTLDGFNGTITDANIVDW